MVSKSKHKEIEMLFLNKANWNKQIAVDGVEEKLIYVSAHNQLRRIHPQNGNTVAIHIGFYIGRKLMMVEGEWSDTGDYEFADINAKEIIYYTDNKYDLEKIKEYYDIEICERLHQSSEGDFETEQEFFEAYIKADPSFTDLFDYDIDPIEE